LGFDEHSKSSDIFLNFTEEVVSNVVRIPDFGRFPSSFVERVF
jgi:hypothetical protein